MARDVDPNVLFKKASPFGCYVLAWFFSLWLFYCHLPSKAGINQGINYLLNSQNTDGSGAPDPSSSIWRRPRLSALWRCFGQKVDIYKQGVQYLK